MPRFGRGLELGLYAIFLLSGFSGLAYQIIWLRQFGLIFGVTAYATSAVLSAFFMGLALGSWLAGRFLTRWKIHPLKLYAALEVGIGGYALAVPFLLASLNGIYTLLTPWLEGSFFALSLMRYVFSALALILPATLMGATLPLVTEALSKRVRNITVNVSGLYAINTLGALAGAAFSGFYAIGTFGMNETTWIAVALNWSAALGAWLIARRLEDEPRVTPVAPPRSLAHAHPKFKILLWGLFLSGFAAIGYEVVWTRILSLFIGRTVFVYTIILCGALLGIALGSWLLRLASPRIRNPLRVLALLEVGVVWMTLVSSVAISQAMPSQTDWGIPLSVGLILVIPNTLLGATLPLAVRIYQEEFERVGLSVGDLYSANVLGGVLGSFTAGFVLLSTLGAQSTLLALALTNALVAVLFFRYSEPLARRVIAPVLAGGTALAFVGLALQPQFLFEGIRRGVFDNEEILFHEEHVEGIVTITQQGIHQTIYLNGSPQSNTRPGLLNTHRTLAHLPLLLHPKPEEMLIIGLGSGTTAGAASAHPLETLRVIELVPGMYRGSAFFDHTNYRVLHDPRVRARVDDGRNFLLVTRERYDVIEADVILPWFAGANNLYSAEYYRLVASRLKPGGIVAQWLHTGIPEKDYKILLRTFVSVFPNTTLWGGGSYAVAMPDGIRIDASIIRARFADPKMEALLQEGGYVSVDQFFASFDLGPEAIRRYVGNGLILTDNHPYLEYNTVLDIGRNFDLPKEDVRPYLTTR